MHLPVGIKCVCTENAKQHFRIETGSYSFPLPHFKDKARGKGKGKGGSQTHLKVTGCHGDRE